MAGIKINKRGESSNERYALVTDGFWRKSLSAIRSLGKQGYVVTVMGDSLFTTGFWSKYAANFCIGPSAVDAPSAFGAKLLACLKAFTKKNKGKPVLLPMEDATLQWVAANIDTIKHLCYVLIPDAHTVAIAENKHETLIRARDLGLPVPLTYSPNTPEELASILRQVQLEGKAQFIVKPVQGSGSSGIKYDVLDLAIDWTRHWEQYGPLLIQERLAAEGKGVGVSLLMDRYGECRAWFVHERLQQFPNSGGPSTDRQSIHHPELLDMSLRLIKSLNWQGIAMVEWKIDSQTQQPKLMEINPRFWGSLELAVRAGVDFPYLYALAAADQPLPKLPEYADGIRCRWLIPGDILRFLTQSKSKREKLRQFVRGLPGLAEEWDSTDLLGTLSAVVCPAITVLNPKYWKFLFR